MSTILRTRATAAFSHPDVVNDARLRKIADAAAGDARVAITILREAAKAADRAGRDHITPEDVDAAIPEGRRTVRDETKQSLKSTQRVLYEIVKGYVSEQGEPMPPSRLYETYQDRAEDPVGDRQVRRHLNKLEHYELITIHGSSRDRRYGLTKQDPDSANHPAHK